MALPSTQTMDQDFLTSNLRVIDVPDEEYDAIYHPTQDFPQPQPIGKGTKSLCERCLTLLRQVVLEFGQGNQLYRSRMAHSIFRLDAARNDYSPTPKDSNVRLKGFVKRLYEPQVCVICKNINILFDTNEKRGTSMADVRITWTLQDVDPQICFRMKFPLPNISVRIEAKQYSQYPITVGSFNLWKDGATDINDVLVQDNPVILPLDKILVEPGATAARNSERDFMSTCGPLTRKMIWDWMQECVHTHSACASPLNIHPSTPDSFVPDRLIYITRHSTQEGEAVLEARIVEKSIPSDFPVLLSENTIYYLSVSHCWGKPPDIHAALEGRDQSVLTLANHLAWKTSIPLEQLSTTAQEAIQVCRAIGFEYIWIDSLCIIQDSLEDWQTQSAMMGDIYRFAWCNIAALWSSSDADGFLNFERDPRVDFGFHVSLPDVLGTEDPASTRNSRGEECILLQGRARLTWDFEPPHGGCTRGPAPLLSRAWVFQERQLARRTLTFTDKTVYWACESANYCENNRWSPTQGQVSSTLCKWERRAISFKAAAESTVTDRDLDAELTQETAVFWTNCVSTYTECKLTKPKDRIIALSSIAKEVSAAGQLSRVKYLAGLWDFNLENQLLWFRPKEKRSKLGKPVFVPSRKRLGDKEYTAPTWSWASVEGSIRSVSFVFDFRTDRKLAFVREADVVLATEFAYGLVDAGYIRLSGRLHKIGSMGFTSPDQPYIIDEATSCRIHFGFDTSADLETVKQAGSKMRWVPIRMTFNKTSIGCRGLVVMETDEHKNRQDAFVKPGDVVYRRLGHMNFGHTVERIENDVVLLRELGTGWLGKGATHEQYLEKFRLRHEELEEFVLI